MNISLDVNEPVVVLVDVQAQVNGEDHTFLVQAGSIGTVIFVHSKDQANVTYEIEFGLGTNGWGQAILQQSDVEAASAGTVYHAVIYPNQPEATGVRVAVVARNLDDARQTLESRYGADTVFNLHNKAEAERPRHNGA